MKATLRSILACAGAVLQLCVLARSVLAAPADRAPFAVGYTEYRADLPGGMHPYFTSMRACVVEGDGSKRRLIAPELVRKQLSWTQFAGWSPDGRVAIVGSGWESSENAAWEEEHKTFRMTEGWLYDMCLVDLESGKTDCLTAIDRVSIYNTGLFYWPGDAKRLGFQALVGPDSHPFSMDLDGRNKKDLTEGSREFAYGFSASPDGKLIAYHRSYQIYIARADGSDAKRVETGNPFNFVPTWSPDGERVLFVSGEHYDCHPYIVRRDGTGLRKLAERGGYRGVVECIEKPSFHSESSDVPLWSPDGKWVYFTAKVDGAVELMRVGMEGAPDRLTRSPPGSFHYHPRVSADGEWIVCGSNKSGTRQLHVLRAGGGGEYQLTRVGNGEGAMWAWWRPTTTQR